MTYTVIIPIYNNQSLPFLLSVQIVCFVSKFPHHLFPRIPRKTGSIQVIKTCTLHISEYSWQVLHQCTTDVLDAEDAVVFDVFISRCKTKTLLHKLGCERLYTVKELLGAVTKHVGGEQVVGANLDRGEAIVATIDGEGSSLCRD